MSLRDGAWPQLSISWNCFITHLLSHFRFLYAFFNRLIMLTERGSLFDIGFAT